MQGTSYKPPGNGRTRSAAYERLLKRRITAGRRHAELASHRLHRRADVAADKVADLEAQLEATGLYSEEDRRLADQLEDSRWHEPDEGPPCDDSRDPCRLCARMGSGEPLPI